MESKKAPKRKTQDVKSEAAAFPFQEEVPDFPRGGASLLSRSEIDEARAEADAEFKADQRQLKKRRKSKQPNALDDDVEALFQGGITAKAPKFVRSLRFKSLSIGMKLLGVIVEVNTKDLVVSLPGGLRGIVQAEETSDVLSEEQSIRSSFTQEDKDKVKKTTLHKKVTSKSRNEMRNVHLQDMFTVGQLVPCTVCKVEDKEENQDTKGRKRIWLSLRLSLLYKGLTSDVIQDGMVMMAYVKSSEDHGHILSFGLPSLSGFSPHEDDKTGSCDSKLKKGQLVQGLVSSIDRERGVVYMKTCPTLVANSMIKDHKGLSVDLLLPGTMVNARVQAILHNGLLLSFLTYFTGMADTFHLQDPFPCSNWQEKISENTRLKARILYVDPATKAVGLTLNPYLVQNKAPPLGVKVGEIFEDAQVLRVDNGIGLLLKIPSHPVPTPGYVNILDVSDDHIKKLEKRFREGSKVRTRVMGFRFIEGVAIATLKASVLEQSVIDHSDIKPGMVVKGKIVAVEPFGAIVEISNGLKALCPLQHMSEFEVVKPTKKFKVGAKLVFRVLGAKSKRITVTHKKTLIMSKLKILANYEDAIEGLITHGWINRVGQHGCFVKFYNGVKGFARRSELGIDLGTEADSVFHTGQAVRCRVISAVPAHRRLELSFVTSSDRSLASEDATMNVKIGDIVSGVVDHVTSTAVILNVSLDKGSLKGTIFSEQLSDNPGHVEEIKSLLKPGYNFDKLIVLDILNQNLIVSVKYSLVEVASSLPSDIVELHPQSVIQGYICNIIEKGCFIRFLGHLTGFAPKSKVLDDFNGDLSQHFHVGQSVRSQILNVEEDTGRITISLKQSACFSTDASLIQGYFLEKDKIARLQASESGGSDIDWAEDFVIGGCVEGEVQEIKDYGVIVDLREHKDIVGFITCYQLGGVQVEIGSVVQARVLDVVKTDGIIELSLRPELMQHAKVRKSKRNQLTKKRCKSTIHIDLELHQKVDAIVEIVRDDYLVLSLPDHENAIAFASTHDYNMRMDPHKHFVAGQKVNATVGALPSALTTGRLLLLLSYLSDLKSTSGFKRIKRSSHYEVGSVVKAEVFSIKPLEMRLRFGNHHWGRVHITELTDEYREGNPFSQYKPGQKLMGKIIAGPFKSVKKGKHIIWDLSVKPSVLSGNEGEGKQGCLPTVSTFAVGDTVTAYVQKVSKESVWLLVSRHIKGCLFVLDSSSEPVELQSFRKRFVVGQAIACRISSVDSKKGILYLTMRELSALHEVRKADSEADMQNNSRDVLANTTLVSQVHEGDIVGGRISKILPAGGGLIIQIGHHHYGRVHFTELSDLWTENPLCGYQKGQFVKCKVLEVKPTANSNAHIDLSLKQSQVSCGSVEENQIKKSEISSVEKIDDLKPNMEVQGYVKDVSSKGCFIMLSRHIDARVLISNLSDTFVENPQEEFPAGKLVKGRIISVEPLSGRVDMTLKTKPVHGMLQASDLCFESFHVGDVISGIIKRVETFGVFITIENSNVVGLCHVSELSDNYIESIETDYRVGERVQVKILKVDEERKRLSLGMKDSYFINNPTEDILSDTESIEKEACNGSESNDHSDLSFQDNDGECKTDNLTEENDDEWETEDLSDDIFRSLPVSREIESRASVPPLEVMFDTDTNASKFAIDMVKESLDNGDSEMGAKDDTKMNKRARRRLKEQRELEIRAAEEKRLEGDRAPDSMDEFERLVRTSPNSSFVWIKYMAFMLSLADVEKARAIAERALQTINFREEGEKLNVWVAYFNLENVYGSPPKEAVLKVFQRALQYCDPKKVYIALLGIYERTEQHEMVDQLLKAMTHKFKSSSKVWLRNLQILLKRGSDVAHKTLERALLCLPRHKHIKFISRAATLEFKVGSPERARSLFEGVLRNYPKRTDLWSVYLDQEICIGDTFVIRALFERVTCLDLPPKKMKFLFKKYLDYEKSQGDEARVEYVKTKAMEFVENKLG